MRDFIYEGNNITSYMW